MSSPAPDPVTDDDPPWPPRRRFSVRERLSVGVSRAEVLVSLALAVFITVLGFPIGLLWRALAPRVELIKTDRGIFPVESDPEGYFADDGWFVMIGGVAGLLLAIGAWVLLRRYRGPFILLGLVVGSAAGAVLAAWLGHRIGLPEYERLLRDAPVGARLRRQPNLRISDVGLWFGFIPRVRGIVLVQAFLAAAVYTLLSSFSSWPSLRKPDEYPDLAAGPISSHSTEQPAQPAESAPPAPGTAEPPPGAGASAHHGGG